MERQLVAGLFDLALAARGLVDDNYAWEVWNTANRYDWQQEEAELETQNLSGEEVFLNTRRLHLRRRLPRTKQRLMPADSSAAPRRTGRASGPNNWAATQSARTRQKTLSSKTMVSFSARKRRA